MDQNDLTAQQMYDMLDEVEMECEEDQAETIISQIPQKNQNILNSNEKKYHWIDMFYGDIIEFELNTIIPTLQSQFSEPQNQSFQDLLFEKILLLEEKQNLLNKQVENQQLNEQQYMKNLKECFLLNKNLLRQCHEQNVDQSIIKRIFLRTNLIEKEINQVYVNVGGSQIQSKIKQSQKNNEQSSEQNTQPIQKQASLQNLQNINKNYDKRSTNTQIQVQVQKNPSQEDLGISVDFLNDSNDDVNQKSQPIQNKRESLSVQSELTNSQKFLTLRQIEYQNFCDFLKKHDPQRRKNDINELELKIQKINFKIQNIINEVEKEQSIDQYKNQFQGLTQDFMIGQPQDKRNKIIEALWQKIELQLQECEQKTPTISKTLQSHYLPLLKGLKQIKNSEFGFLPKIQQKQIAMKFRNINGKIKPGQMIIKVGSINSKSSAKYYLIIKDDYFKRQLKTEPVKKGNALLPFGNFLDNSKLRPSITTKTITFVLIKKNIFNEKEIGSCQVSYQGFKTENQIKDHLHYEIKGEQIKISVNLFIRQGFSQSQTVMNVFVADKFIPLYKKPSGTSLMNTFNTMSQRLIQQFDETSQTIGQQKNSISSQNRKQQSSFTKTPQSTKISQNYPLIQNSEKQILIAFIQKNPGQKYILDFQEQIFGITFLEKFIEELKQQNTQESKKLLENSEKMYNSLVSSVQNEEMSQQDYKQLITKFRDLDKLNLSKFTKLKLQNPIKFTKNRINDFNEEINSL